MTGLWTLDPSGQYVKSTKGMWVADDSGTFQPVKNAWAAGADGTYLKVWPYVVAINDFSGVKGAAGYPNYYALTLTWSVSNTDHVELRLAGSSSILYSGTASTMSFSGIPGTNYTFNLRAIAADGSYVDSPPVSVLLDSLPAPANFRRAGGTPTISTWAWNDVDQATKYEVVDTLAANAVKGTITPPEDTFLEVGLTASTTYERAVRAKLSTATSPLSNKVRYTTPAPIASAPGTYDFKANYMEAWGAISGWRGAASGAMHGDGDNWGSHNGVLVTMFFYTASQLAAVNGRVTRFKIRLKRDSSSGYSSPQGNHFFIHTALNRPSGSPVPALGGQTDVGSLAWGQESTFDLPVSWGQALLDGTYNSKGIAWGYVLARYMRGPTLAAYPDQGHLYITIG